MKKIITLLGLLLAASMLFVGCPGSAGNQPGSEEKGPTSDPAAPAFEKLSLDLSKFGEDWGAKKPLIANADGTYSCEDVAVVVYPAGDVDWSAYSTLTVVVKDFKFEGYFQGQIQTVEGGDVDDAKLEANIWWNEDPLLKGEWKVTWDLKALKNCDPKSIKQFWLQGEKFSLTIVDAYLE